MLFVSFWMWPFFHCRLLALTFKENASTAFWLFNFNANSKQFNSHSLKCFRETEIFFCFLFLSSALDLPHQRADLDVDGNFPGERRPIPEWLSCHEGSKITLWSRESIYNVKCVLLFQMQVQDVQSNMAGLTCPLGVLWLFACEDPV